MAASSTPRNIARIDIDATNTHGYQVRIRRQGEKHTKFFSDTKCGGKEGALQEAIGHRDEMLEILPEPAAGPRVAALARSKTGVPGIRLGTYTTEDGPIPRIEAEVSGHGGANRRNRTWSLRRYPLRKALWQACAWRAKERAELRGETVGPSVVEEMYRTAYASITDQMAKNFAHFEPLPEPDGAPGGPPSDGQTPS